MNIIGIDVGFSGAIAQILDIRADGLDEIDAVDMPTLKDGAHTELNEPEIKDLLVGANHVFIEKAQTMPIEHEGRRQGTASSGRYMMSYGQVRGICAGMGIPYTLVHPKTWKKVMMADMPKDKSASIIRAKKLFPQVKLDRKKDHGRADALLLAEYGRRILAINHAEVPGAVRKPGWMMGGDL